MNPILNKQWGIPLYAKGLRLGGVGNWLRLLLVPVFGIGVSLHISGLFHTDELSRKQKHLDAQIEIQKNSLQLQIVQNLDILDSVGAFFEATEVFREEFRDFTKDILSRHKEVLKIAWVPKIKAFQRPLIEQEGRNSGVRDFHIYARNSQGDKLKSGPAEVHFPIVYMEPSDKATQLLGLDLMSITSIRSAMHNAVENNKKTIAMVDDSGLATRDNIRILVFRPVFKYNSDIITQKKADPVLVGFVTLMFFIDDLVHSALPSIDTGLDFVIRHTGTLNTNLLHVHSSQPHGGPFSYSDFIGKTNKEYFRTNSVSIVDTYWAIDYAPSPAFMAQFGYSQSRIILLEGLIISALFTFFLVLLHKRLIEKEELAVSLTSANQSLQESESKFKSITGAAQDSILVIDEQDHIQLANSAVELTFGYSNSEIVGKEYNMMFVTNRLFEEFEFSLHNCTVTQSRLKSSNVQELIGVHKDGHEIPLEVSLASFMIDQHRHAVGILRDISERKRIDKKLRNLTSKLKEQVHSKTRDLRRSEEQLRATVCAMAEGLLVIDDKGKVVLVNPTLENMFLLDEKTAYGMRLVDLIQPKTAGKPWLSNLDFAPLMTLVDGQVHHNDELSFDSGRSDLTVSCTAAPIKDKQKVIGAVVTFHDISERKKIEQFKDEMISTVDHELRTPFTKMHGFAELLMSSDFDKKKSDALLKIIWEESRNVGYLLDDFSDLRHFQDRNIDLQMHEEQLEVLIDCELLREWENKNKNHQFVFSATPNLPAVWVNRESLVRAVSAIVSNSVKFSPQGGEIEITIVLLNEFVGNAPIWVFKNLKRDESVLIGIKDHGIGIDQERYNKIFLPFYRVDSSSTSRFGGAGLGLALVKEIVNRHSGFVWVDSQTNIGSTFFIALPVQKDKIRSMKRVCIAPNSSDNRTLENQL